ncbi:MAG: asparagine synthase C-terminal domain-containing protein, partial [candidate division KSB1 bacterium]|nr:asparagine synthase C-terminal domain-containing protein [candidate division KSB1 bacterium]
SGGVDSTANVALMSQVSGSTVHTFTAGFQGQEAYDERQYARRAAAHFKTEHHEIEITPRQLVEVLPELAFYLDEPVADATVVPIYFVSQLARQHGAIVILNGDGSDELFCGYHKYLQYLRLEPCWRWFNRLPRFLKTAVAQTSQRLGVNGTAGDLLRRAARGIELYAGATGALKGTAVFEEMSNGNVEVYRGVMEGRREFEQERRGRDYCEWLSYWGLRSEVEHVFLYRADRLGMANSIEIRVPFLDHRLVEFALQMPQALKYKNGEKKYILKQALRGLVPDEFLDRTKQGFCVPLREWAGSMMQDKILTVLPRLHTDWGVLSPAFLQAMRTHMRFGRDQGFLSWNLYTLATWYERWFC